MTAERVLCIIVKSLFSFWLCNSMSLRTSTFSSRWAGVDSLVGTSSPFFSYLPKTHFHSALLKKQGVKHAENHKSCQNEWTREQHTFLMLFLLQDLDARWLWYSNKVQLYNKADITVNLKLLWVCKICLLSIAYYTAQYFNIHYRWHFYILFLPSERVIHA